MRKNTPENIKRNNRRVVSEKEVRWRKFCTCVRISSLFWRASPSITSCHSSEKNHDSKKMKDLGRCRNNTKRVENGLSISYWSRNVVSSGKRFRKSANASSLKFLNNQQCPQTFFLASQFLLKGFYTILGRFTLDKNRNICFFSKWLTKNWEKKRSKGKSME